MSAKKYFYYTSSNRMEFNAYPGDVKYQCCKCKKIIKNFIKIENQGVTTDVCPYCQNDSHYLFKDYIKKYKDNNYGTDVSKKIFLLHNKN